MDNKENQGKEEEIGQPVETLKYPLTNTSKTQILQYR